jgi:diphosphomevalonate decarboxylase
VAWDMGTREDGMDSVARVVAPRSHWPEMRALILVVSAEKKGISSTAGMQATVKTSALYKTRTQEVVPKAMEEMEKAIKEKNFQNFARITMKESNSFHASCLDTEPPIFYLNDVSRAAIRAVESLNEKAGRNVAAYTFDAGPNAVIYYEEKSAELVAASFEGVLGNVAGWEGKSWQTGLTGQKVFDEKITKVLSEGVNRVILTGIGEGPVSVQEHLVDENGNAIEVSTV